MVYIGDVCVLSVTDYCFSYSFPSLKLSASLKTLEEDRNQIYTQLSEIDATNEDLTGKVP